MEAESELLALVIQVAVYGAGIASWRRFFLRATFAEMGPVMESFLQPLAAKVTQDAAHA